MIALKYNVGSNLIKRANDLITEEIFSKKELLIPIVPGMTLRVEAPETEVVKKKNDDKNRQMALQMLCEKICELQGCSKSVDFSEEANFYLSENGNDYRKAADAYTKDF